MQPDTDVTEYNPHRAPMTAPNRFRVPVPQQLAVLAAIMLLIFAGAATTIVGQLINRTAVLTEAITTAPSEASAPAAASTEDAPVTFDTLSIVGEAAYVFDIQTGHVLYEKNADLILPLASVTKLMTALVAHELLTENESVTISDASLRQYGNSGLLEHETFRRQSLSDLVLMSSSNDGAYALAASAGSLLSPTNGVSAFVTAMNIRAQELGLTNTSFKNTTGLDISEHESGADGTAADMAKLMAYIVQSAPDLLAFTTESTAAVESEDGFSHDGQNTNFYIDEIPGLIGSKTGYTTLAGGNLVIAFNAGLDRPIVIAVLGSGRTARFTDVIGLAAAAQTAITTSTP